MSMDSWLLFLPKLIAVETSDTDISFQPLVLSKLISELQGNVNLYKSWRSSKPHTHNS